MSDKVKKNIVIIDTQIKIIIGLGNPEKRFETTRHNIGFCVVDALADRHDGSWSEQKNMLISEITINEYNLTLVKPLTYMNSSGAVMPYFTKKGIKAESVLVVHDELEKKFGTLSFKVGGSHRGHNGLRSLIQFIGPNFARLRFGIGRPQDKVDVGNYVLRNFLSAEQAELEHKIDQACEIIEGLFSNP